MDNIRSAKLPPGYISVYEFARQSRRTINTVYSQLYSGSFEGAAKFGGKWGIPVRHLREKLEDQQLAKQEERDSQQDARKHETAS
jgi:hypothetical protein